MNKVVYQIGYRYRQIFLIHYRLSEYRLNSISVHHYPYILHIVPTAVVFLLSRTLYTYAPYDQQPPVDRKPEQLSEVHRFGLSSLGPNLTQPSVLLRSLSWQNALALKAGFLPVWSSIGIGNVDIALVAFLIQITIFLVLT